MGYQEKGAENQSLLIDNILFIFKLNLWDCGTVNTFLLAF